MPTFYSFEQNVYSDYDDGREELMQAIYVALVLEAYTDSENNGAEAEESVSMAMEGTNAETFWDGLILIMQRSPYELNIRKLDVTLEPSTDPELSEIEKLQIAQLIEEDI